MADMLRLKEIFSGETLGFEEFFERLNARPDILNEYVGADDFAAASARFEAEKAAREKDAADFANEMAAVRRDMMVDMALSQSGAKNIKAVRALLNEDAVTLQNGVLAGIEQEIGRITKDCPYLFKSRGTGYNPPAPAAGETAAPQDESERWRAEAGLPAREKAGK